MSRGRGARGDDERVELDGPRRGKRPVDDHLRRPDFSMPPTGAITSAVDTLRRQRLGQLGDAGEVGAGVGDHADLASGDGPGLGHELRQRRRET